MIYDVLIVGGGLVGASLAAALKSSGLSIALVEGQSPPTHSTDAPLWDTRIYAISPGSATFLEQCGAWSRLDLYRVQQVEQMRVFGDTGAELDFSAYQIGAPELAFILENDALQHALWKGLRAQDNLTLFHGARCASIHWEQDSACLRLDDEREIKAKLVVGADGRESWVRHQAGMIEPSTQYQQHGVVANFRSEIPHRGIAYQWFQEDGVLALLPLPQQHVSMVWSIDSAKAERLLHLPPDELCAEIGEASHHSLGTLELVTPPAAFPLYRLNLRHIVQPRLALIGDAAHSVHPLAGQGVNLGFRDARELAQVLVERGPHTDCGNISLLRRYERARKEDILSMIYTTDTLKKLFNTAHPVLRNVRNIGLSVTNRISPLKKLLARHALN